MSTQAACKGKGEEVGCEIVGGREGGWEIGGGGGVRDRRWERTTILFRSELVAGEGARVACSGRALIRKY